MSSETDVSKIMSEKMLQGYKMSNNHCPICTTILLVDKSSGRSYCCSCKAFLVTPEQASKLDLKPHSSPAIPVNNPVPVVSAVAAVDPTWDDIDESEAGDAPAPGTKAELFQTIKSKLENLKKTVIDENNSLARRITQRSTPKRSPTSDTNAVTDETSADDISYVTIGPPDWGLPDSSPKHATLSECPASSLGAGALSNNVDDENDDHFLSSDDESSSTKKVVYSSSEALSYDVAPVALSSVDKQEPDQEKGLDIDRDWESFFDSPQPKVDDAMQKVEETLAERMLNRWALLGYHCLDCETPLVSKDSIIECVLCQTNYSILPDGSLEALDKPSKSRTESIDSVTPPTTESSPKTSPEDEMDEIDRFFEIPTPRPSKKDTTSQKLGQHMLEGWTMLASTCESKNCITPLLRQKTTGIIKCVACGFVETPVEDNRAADEGKQEQLSSNSNEPVAESPVEASPTAEQNKFLELLELARQQQYDDYDIVNDTTNYEALEGEELTDEQTRALLESPAMEQMAVKSREMSSKIAQHLSAGYSLSELSCCDCFYPLMQDDQTRLFCISCGAKYMSEHNYSKKLAKMADNDDSDKPTTPQSKALPSDNDKPSSKSLDMSNSRLRSNVDSKKPSFYTSLADLTQNPETSQTKSQFGEQYAQEYEFIESSLAKDSSILSKEESPKEKMDEKTVAEASVSKSSSVSSGDKKLEPSEIIASLESKLLKLGLELVYAEGDDIVVVSSRVKAISEAILALRKM